MVIRFILFLLGSAILLAGCSSEKNGVSSEPSKTGEVQTKAAEKSGPQTPMIQESNPAAVAVPPSISSPVSKNNLPEIVTIKLTPRLVYPGTRVKAEAEGKDADGDTVSFYFEWKRNDEVLSGEVLSEIDTSGFKKGDFITVTVTPFDEKEKGKPRRSLPLIVANRPPVITSTPAAGLSNGKYVYEVKAADPDGDKLTFSLEGGPPGMTIDPATGVVRWEGFNEKTLKQDSIYNIKIEVSDGDAKAFQGFELSLTR